MNSFVEIGSEDDGDEEMPRAQKTHEINVSPLIAAATQKRLNSTGKDRLQVPVLEASNKKKHAGPFITQE
jgi:hypothetical protein